MKFVVSKDREEILKVISQASLKHSNILWQTHGDQRIIHEIDSFEYDPIREVIRCQIPELESLDLQSMVYLKSNHRNTIFKGYIQIIYKNYAYIQVPEEVKLEELREFPRYVFTPEEQRQIKISIPSLVMDGAREHFDVNLIDLGQGGLGLLLPSEQRNKIFRQEDIRLSQLGNFEFKSEVGMQTIWEVDYNHPKSFGEREYFKKIGLKLIEPLPVRLMTNFIRYEEDQFAHEIGFLGNSPRFKKRMNKEYHTLMSKLSTKKKIFDYFREANIRHDVGMDYLPRHIRTLSLTSCALSRLLGGANKDNIKTLTYTAMVHDIAYFNNPKLAQIKGREHFEKIKQFLNLSEKELYYRSYHYAFDYSTSDIHAPEDAAFLIDELRQYHLAKDKRVFARLGKMSDLAVIFVVAHDLTDYILSHPQWTFYDYLQTYPFFDYGKVFESIFEKLSAARAAA